VYQKNHRSHKIFRKRKKQPCKMITHLPNLKNKVKIIRYRNKTSLQRIKITKSRKTCHFLTRTNPPRKPNLQIIKSQYSLKRQKRKMINYRAIKKYRIMTPNKMMKDLFNLIKLRKLKRSQPKTP